MKDLQTQQRKSHYRFISANHRRGFSTIELLIAFSLIVLVLSGVIITIFGNQSLTLDANLNNLAIYKAQERLEMAYASTTRGYDPYIPETIDNIFTLSTIVKYHDCFWEVAGRAEWWENMLRPQEILIPSKFVNIAASEALGHDCSTEAPSSTGWESPEPYDNPDIIHPGSTATDVDVIENEYGVFALVTSEKNGTHETFWVIDVTDPDNPSLEGAVSTEEDLYALDAYEDGDIAYAFVASASTTAQLQVIEVDFRVSPISVKRTAAKRLLGTVSTSANSAARAVFYYDNKVYIATNRTIGQEFHVFTVSDPNNPIHRGNLELNHSVRDIEVRDVYAYLAATAQTAEGCELIVIDVRDFENLSNPCIPGSTDGEMNFRAPGEFDGTAVEITAGDMVYLGRERAADDHDFYVLDTSDLNNITSLGSVDLNINSGREVVALNVEGDLAFIATSDTTPANGGGPFMVYNVADPSTMYLVSTCTLNFSEQSTGMDFYNNHAYVTNVANDALRIVFPSPTCS